MKRFQFSLDTVLDYKIQVLENLKTEQAVINQAVRSQEEAVSRVNRALYGYEHEFNQTKASGAAIEHFRLYDMCIVKTKETLEEEKKRLAELEEKKELKKQEVVAAKVDTSKFEKLKGRRLEAYNRAVAKAEEQFTEEFIVREQVRNRIQYRG